MTSAERRSAKRAAPSHSARVLDGNSAVAQAVRLARPGVVPAYPITPQTTIVEGIAKMVDSGQLPCEFICVESEHSAMAACVGASACGARTFTATASQGLLLMHEMLHWAALARLPVVMVNVNRAVGPGWNIWCDHNDSVAQRDTGWIQWYVGDVQEALDLTITAFRFAEDPAVRLPVMVCMDGFLLSHTAMPCEVPTQEQVDAFLPPFRASWILDPERPASYGNLVPPAAYMEARRDQERGMRALLDDVVPAAAVAFRAAFGRELGGPLEVVHPAARDLVIMAMGSMASEAKIAVAELRKAGIDAGLVRVRCYRPFPAAEIAAAIGSANVLVLDRAVSPGAGAPLETEVGAVLRKSTICSAIVGLGGSEVPASLIVQLGRRAMKEIFVHEYAGVPP